MKTLIKEMEKLGISLEDVLRIHCSTDADASGDDENDEEFIEECVREWLEAIRQRLRSKHN